MRNIMNIMLCKAVTQRITYLTYLVIIIHSDSNVLLQLNDDIDILMYGISSFY